MKDKKQQFGYTIVEVMIVLAVSGVMFVVAVNFINGKQAKTAFVQGSNEMGVKIQKMIDDVANGRYSDVQLGCDIGSGSAVASYVAGKEQGTNPDCVFLGKLMHFYIKDGTSLPENYEVISLADLRSSTDDDGWPRDTIAQINNLTVQQKIPQALGVKNMTVTRPGGATDTNAYSFGFVQGAGSIADASTGKYKSGAQTLRTIYSDGTTKGSSATSASASRTNIKAATSATICLTDGKRYARISIGGTGESNQLGVKVQQLGLTSC